MDKIIELIRKSINIRKLSVSIQTLSGLSLFFRCKNYCSFMLQHCGKIVFRERKYEFKRQLAV